MDLVSVQPFEPDIVREYVPAVNPVAVKPPVVVPDTFEDQVYVKGGNPCVINAVTVPPLPVSPQVCEYNVKFNPESLPIVKPDEMVQPVLSVTETL